MQDSVHNIDHGHNTQVNFGLVSWSYTCLLCLKLVCRGCCTSVTVSPSPATRDPSIPAPTTLTITITNQRPVSGHVITNQRLTITSSDLEAAR